MRNSFLELSKIKNIDVYKNINYNQIFNTYNKKTLKKIRLIEKNLGLPYFKIPSYSRNTVWGRETIFLPFTDKLFKIVDTCKGDTSIQLHPIKNETWFPLKKSIIYNGKNLIDIDSLNIVEIKAKSIHCMKKGGMVFEIQDNIVFDNKETIRIFDINNRQLDSESLILKNTMPQISNNLRILKNKSNIKINGTMDLFIFCIDGEINLKLNNKKIQLENRKLYFVNKKYTKFIEAKGIYVVCPAKYLKYSNEICRNI